MNIRSVDIVIPVFNEKATIRTVLEKVLIADVLGLEKRVIVVDDASNDGTRDVLEKYSEKCRVISNNKNSGKGFSVIKGIRESCGDLVIVQDADLEYDPSEYPKMIKPILEGRADVVYGSRFAGGGPHRVLYFWHYLGNKILTTLSNMLTDLNLTDMETGYKIFKRTVLDNFLDKMESKRFGFEPEITARLARLARKGKCRVFEVGVSYNGRTYEEGKKIGWADGLEAIWCIIKFNLLR